MPISTHVVMTPLTAVLLSGPQSSWTDCGKEIVKIPVGTELCFVRRAKTKGAVIVSCDHRQYMVFTVDLESHTVVEETTLTASAQ